MMTGVHTPDEWPVALSELVGHGNTGYRAGCRCRVCMAAYSGQQNARPLPPLCRCGIPAYPHIRSRCGVESVTDKIDRLHDYLGVPRIVWKS